MISRLLLGLRQTILYLGRRFWIPAVIALLILGLWKVPEWQINRLKNVNPVEVPKLQNEYRKTFAQIIGGLGLLFGLFLTWRRIRAIELNVEIAQEGQITERFTRAIDQLGDKEHLEVRLGGIYALERIAKDSPKDHWTIMEVLTAYVRANAPWEGKIDQLEKRSKNLKKKPEDESQPEQTEIRPPADIQAILTILGRRTLAHERGEDRELDLSQTDLRGVDISHGFLGEANLGGANLQKAYLVRANLQEADVRRADLKEAKFLVTILTKANLQGARNITVEQLSKVETLYNTKLDPELMEQIEKDYPHLLKEPKFWE